MYHLLVGNDPADSLTVSVARLLTNGNSVLLLESHDTSVKNIHLLDVGERLRAWVAAGAKHLVLEMDAPDAQLLNRMLDAHEPLQQMAAKFEKQTGYTAYVAHAYCQLAVDAQKAGLRIEGADHMKAAYDRAISQLSDQDRLVLSRVVDKKAENLTSEEEHVKDKVTIGVMDGRSSSDGREPVRSDRQIADELARSLHGEKFVGIYGSLHALGANDLNEMLSQSTGHHVKTMQIDGGENGRKAIATILSRHVVVDVPDFRYDPYKDVAHPLPNGHTTDPNCFRVEDWEKACHQAAAANTSTEIRPLEDGLAAGHGLANMKTDRIPSNSPGATHR